MEQLIMQVRRERGADGVAAVNEIQKIGQYGCVDVRIYIHYVPIGRGGKIIEKAFYEKTPKGVDPAKTCKVIDKDIDNIEEMRNFYEAICDSAVEMGLVKKSELKPIIDEWEDLMQTKGGFSDAVVVCAMKAL